MAQMTLDQVKKILENKVFTIIKYVRLTDDTFRFGDLYYSEHRYLVRNGETAASAGLVVFNEDNTLQTKGNSMTLKLTPDAGDAAKIAALVFGKSNVKVADQSL